MILASLQTGSIESSRAVSVVFWAAIGGLIVLAGVFMEVRWEKHWYRNTCDFWRSEKIRTLGGWLVVIGVLWEVVTASVFAVKEEIDIRTTRAIEASIDPRKQPIFAFSAYAIVLVKPLEPMEVFDNETLPQYPHPPEFFKLKLPQSNADPITLFLDQSKDVGMTMNFGNASISSDNVSQTISTFGGQKLLRYDVYFGENQSLFLNTSVTPENLDAIDLPLPIHCEVVSGKIEMTINNGYSKKTFKIPPQISAECAVTSVALTNGTFAPVKIDTNTLAGLERSTKQRLARLTEMARFRAAGFSLETNANGSMIGERTISDEQKRLFISLVQDFPKIPIKVLVYSGDTETINYAKKVRELLVSANYGSSGDAINTNLGGGIFIGTNQSPWSPTPHTLVYLAVPCKDVGFFIPVTIPFNDTKPRISSGLTNAAESYALAVLDCAKGSPMTWFQG